MHEATASALRGLDALRTAVLDALLLEPALCAAGPTANPFVRPTSRTSRRPAAAPWLLAESAPEPSVIVGTPGRHRAEGSGTVSTSDRPLGDRPPGDQPPGEQPDDSEHAMSAEADEATRERMIALVELARSGDKEAFGLLFDHYHPSVYRFIYYRTRSQALAEDLASETFFRALRSMNNFRWQGRDFGAWLMTIARNLCTDHFKAGRTRLELTTEDMGLHDDATDGPETAVLAQLTNETLLTCLKQLPKEQQECLIMRFLQSMSIADTAKVLGRTEGAVKQLQLRGVRNLAKLMPKEVHSE
ncbi:sigma-70 family RNA polymerase sigma factor [Nocardioides cavernaquae]|uniref:Sigma-70 family RNA polymerase sigma factor n=1 Tax=Nocardioides cavernaquae TaxID=2321396 RepID=A0A3A5H604_9ACTN|nr:sigma-70 family RNA polymerase sigma factor [Nocardioides cavernaquae]RJS46109.1 sigma-70 family RNA polymerase sigma factor [Nocardioides cavernaquae]